MTSTTRGRTTYANAARSRKNKKKKNGVWPGLNKRRALIEWAKDNGLDDPNLVTPGTPDVSRSRNRKMRGFFGLR